MKQFALRLDCYIREAWRISRQWPVDQSFARMLSFFPSWNRSLSLTPTEMRIPWISYPAIKMLEKILKPEMRVFEWGVGGSTLFFSARVRQLVSIEHDLQWAEKIRTAMELNDLAWELFVVPPGPSENRRVGDPGNPEFYASALEACIGLSFHAYATVIDRFPDNFFNLILIDGRSRISCAFHGISKIKRGGYLLLDDAERPRYAWIHREMQRLGWKTFNLVGPAPCEWNFRQTGCWQRPP